MRPKVHTEKHIVNKTVFTVALGGILNLTIAEAVSAPAAASPTEVREGSSISAVYLEMWITGDDAALSSAVVTFEKLMGGQTPLTVGQSAALQSYPNKRNIFHTFIGLIPTNAQFPMGVVKGWFKIPKGKQRMGLGDQLKLNVHAQLDGLTCCGLFLYKEQY